MQKNRFVKSAIASAVILSSMFALSGYTAQAQPGTRSVSLLRGKCVNGGNGSVRKGDIDVSIGKAVYTSRFYLGPGKYSSEMTCKFKPDSRPESPFQTLNLEYGMRDNDTSPSVMVMIFLDGREVDRQAVAPRLRRSVSLDVSNASNISIRAECGAGGGAYCDRVYFVDAELVTKPLPQQQAPVQQQTPPPPPQQSPAPETAPVPAPPPPPLPQRN